MYYNNSKINISVGLVIYVSNYVTEFLLILKNLINNNSKYKNNLIIGDFNLDISNHESINQEFLHILLEHVYCPGVRNITRPFDRNNNSGTCIDNIFIKLIKLTIKLSL